MITEFKENYWYRLVNPPKERPRRFNDRGKMDFMLDGEWHRCKDSKYEEASFYDSLDPDWLWDWSGSMDQLEECKDPTKLVKYFKKDYWYRWPNPPKERPSGFNDEGHMDFILDGKWHQCSYAKKEYETEAAFYNSDSQTSISIWDWSKFMDKLECSNSTINPNIPKTTTNKGKIYYLIEEEEKIKEGDLGLTGDRYQYKYFIDEKHRWIDKIIEQINKEIKQRDKQPFTFYRKKEENLPKAIQVPLDEITHNRKTYYHLKDKEALVSTHDLLLGTIDSHIQDINVISKDLIKEETTKKESRKGVIMKTIQKTKKRTLKATKRVTAATIMDRLIGEIKTKANSPQLTSILDSELGKLLAPIVLAQVAEIFTEDKEDKTSKQVNEFCSTVLDESVQKLVATFFPSQDIAQIIGYMASNYLEQK